VAKLVSMINVNNVKSCGNVAQVIQFWKNTYILPIEIKIIKEYIYYIENIDLLIFIMMHNQVLNIPT